MKNDEKLYLHSVVRSSYMSQLIMGGPLRFSVCLAYDPSHLDVSGFHILLNPDGRIADCPDTQCRNKPLNMKEIKIICKK